MVQSKPEGSGGGEPELLALLAVALWAARVPGFLEPQTLPVTEQPSSPQAEAAPSPTTRGHPRLLSGV